MNAERLLAHYEKIADAPDAITRLRRFILDLAVRGKLVPQDANDEPASELLKRIAREKARLVRAGEIKVRSISSRDRQAQVVFQCPIGWSLTEPGEVALKITDEAHKTPTYVERGVPFVSVKDFSAGNRDLLRTRFIPEHEHKLLYQRCDPRRGDILLGRIGMLGKAALVDTDVEFSLTVDKIRKIPLPLPPLAEQHCIVAKVDALMALCDRLEASLTDTATTRRRLADGLLTEALAPVDAREVEAGE